MLNIFPTRSTLQRIFGFPPSPSSAGLVANALWWGPLFVSQAIIWVAFYATFTPMQLSNESYERDLLARCSSPGSHSVRLQGACQWAQERLVADHGVFNVYVLHQPLIAWVALGICVGLLGIAARKIVRKDPAHALIGAAFLFETLGLAAYCSGIMVRA